MRPAVGALLQEIAGKRLVVKPFGDAWMVSTRLGRQTILPGLEEVAAEIVSGPIDWLAVTARTGEAVTGAAPELACPSAPVLERIATSPLPTHDSLSETAPELTPGQLTTGLLVRAANALS
ncbi:hypothetical protein [Arthrobacter sp. TB 23]|uniref:hypothetical protein n=1 Tax=Arthrobacter sp. TB 23 TaxID=494419 RepID=UPI0012EA0ED9|nr:hypothetical protein [Arthrobacter sp. TB 23]